MLELCLLQKYWIFYLFISTLNVCVWGTLQKAHREAKISLWGDNSHGIFQVTFILVRMLTEFITAEIYFGSCDAQQDFTEAHCIQCDVIGITSQCGLGLRMRKYVQLSYSSTNQSN